jgi:hypothetical protein
VIRQLIAMGMGIERSAGEEEPDASKDWCGASGMRMVQWDDADLQTLPVFFRAVPGPGKGGLGIIRAGNRVCVVGTWPLHSFPVIKTNPDRSGSMNN